MRISLPIALAGAALFSVVSPVLAAPQLKGVYSISGTQMCQAPLGKTGGDIEHQMGSAVFTATSATESTMKLTLKDQWGSSVSNAGSIVVNTVTVDGTATISGTANPYGITLKMKVGSQTFTTTGFALLDLDGATNGIARRAVIQSTSSNGQMNGINCTTQMMLFHR